MYVDTLLLLLVLCVQDLLEDSHAHGTDASGNPILKDVGMFMRSELKSAFKDADVKYIDPSYIIR
jgi:6-phosphofructokinase 1